jgi:plasmid stabilization system protein ParE
MRVRYTAAARADLKAIQAHIARDSVAYAKRLVQSIRAAVNQLTSFPELGGVVEDWGRDDLRELIVGNYRIIYRLFRREIRIRTVVHAARMLPEQPEE